MVLVTVLSGRTSHLPGIALESRPLLLIERGVAVLAALVVAITLVARTFKRELPTGLSTAIASVKYAETVEAAASSTDATMAELKARLDEQDAKELMQDQKLTTLTNLLAAIAAVVRADERPNPPGR
jgi:predicted membrane chloride channel (bestrophin family)